jgi:protein-tyrosine phosphatase
MTALAAIDKFGRKWSGHPVWRYSWITPHILLGGQPAKRLIPNLDDLGFTGVINMRDEYDYKAEVGNEPLRYLRLPTPDNTPPTLDHLAQGAAFIKEELDKGGKVYIHCWEGLGRGPTMVAAYFVSTGISPADACAPHAGADAAARGIRRAGQSRDSTAKCRRGKSARCHHC